MVTKKRNKKVKSKIEAAVPEGASEAMPEFGEPGEVQGDKEPNTPDRKEPATEKPVESPAPSPKDKRRTKAPFPTLTCLGAVANDYLAALAGKGKSAGTARSYAADVAVLLKALGRDTEIATISEAQVAAFFESDAVTKRRDGREKDPVSVAKIRRIARQVFLYAEEIRLVELAPLPHGTDTAA